MLNFNIPYLAKNPSDFWRRWHISLSTWLRDYLYVSLGGNRLGPNRTYLNLMLVMLLGGLWHGAAWNFVFWGAYHGALLAVHRLFRPLLSNYTGKLGQFSSQAFSFLSVCTMFVFTLYGWLLFRVTSLDQILSMSARFVPSAIDPSVAADFAKVLMLVSPLLMMQFFQSRKEDTEFLVKTGLATQTLFFTFCIYGIMIFGKYDGSNFIYFQF
jgi:D-alanyl-lipoteichoic acid acyltransferase DltB (MBOAT superfamily)